MVDHLEHTWTRHTTKNKVYTNKILYPLVVLDVSKHLPEKCCYGFARPSAIISLVFT
jgi:hypothetical protein